jgi:beta-glucosidase
MGGFPDGFWWGTASSATQCEGAAPASDWAVWEREGRAPPSGDGNGFGRRFAEDFALLAGLGLTHHRLSIDWARIEPAEGRRDRGAVEHYREVLQAAREAGIAVWACLHHFTVPAWFLAEGGFVEGRSRGRYWPRHVAFVAETFGDLVFGWKPINEPAAYAAAGYLRGEFPPGTRNERAFANCLRGMALAWRDAAKELRGGRQPVATILNLSPVFPADDTAAARRQADLVDRVLWGVWCRALNDGVLSVPGLPDEEVPGLAGSADIIGFSYYSALAVDGAGGFHPYPGGHRVGPLGYAPWSEGLGITIRRLAEALPGRPLLVAEHGVGTTDDAWRCDVLRESLAVVEEAVADGIDLCGFFHWTSVDNYEWLHGFDVPFGLADRDRSVRPSGELLASFAGREPAGGGGTQTG